jgi:hypothetical protein
MSDQNKFASRRREKDAVALGKKYSETRYANPSRTGCPGAATLKAMAKRDRRLTLQDMPVGHVVTCSPCFTEYLRYRRTAIVFRGAKWVAAAILIVGAAVATSRFVFNRSPQQARITEEGAPIQLEVNLQPFSPTRGDNDPEKVRAPIQLPAKSLRVTFLLPLGADAGDYTVRLLNPAGSAKIEREVKVALNRGIASFALDMHLEPADVGLGWTLMIRDPDLVWLSYPVAIGARK